MNEGVTIENLPQIIKKDIVEKQNKYIAKISKSFVHSVKIENSRFFHVIKQIPLVCHALKFEKGFTAVIPEEFSKKIKEGSFKIMQGKDGSLISNIVDTTRGKVVHQMRLEEFTKLVNSSELSQAMNQMCVQLQLEEIQKNLMKFRVETNTKLNEILLKLHGDRMIPTDSVKLSFKRYQESEKACYQEEKKLQREIQRENLCRDIDYAKASLCKEISDNIKILRQGNYTSISPEEGDEIQNKIGFVLESINGLRELYMIERYFYMNDEKKCEVLTREYTEFLLDNLSEEDIKILDAYSDFSYLGLTENIWETMLLPISNSLLEQKRVLKRYTLEELSK